MFLEQIDPPHVAAQCVEDSYGGLTSLASRSEAPLSAADVRNPLRRLWPA